ncbi:MAG: hypothetical protein ACEPOZ_10300 [Marinifilaceae bacterium]
MKKLHILVKIGLFVSAVTQLVKHLHFGEPSHFLFEFFMGFSCGLMLTGFVAMAFNFCSQKNCKTKFI